MKFEIEIPEQEIKAAVERQVRIAISDHIRGYGAGTYIRDQVKAHWTTAVNALIEEALADSDKLKEKIHAEIERKLRLQLAAAMKKAKDGVLWTR